MPRLALPLLGGFQARLGPGSPLALPAKVQALLGCLACAPASPTPVTSSPGSQPFPTVTVFTSPWFQLDCPGFVRFTVATDGPGQIASGAGGR